MIIAKEGNTYAVLTSDHVICKKNEQTRKCIDYTYSILAPDGKKYSVDASTIRRQEGVDLAVVRFTSNENYQVAQLANYPLTDDDAIFVAGYPRLRRNKPASWLFSLGIPVNTFIGLADRLQFDSTLLIQDNRPRELNTLETKAFQDAILGTKIPQGNATAEIWLERGNQLWRLVRYQEAVKAFDKVISLKPEFIHLAYYGKGLALAYEGELEAALASFELAIEIQPNFAPVFLHKSILLKKSNRLDEALIAINKAIASQEKNANLYNQKGVFLKDLKRYSEAEKALNQAISISPRAIFYSNRGNLYSDQGKVELALADYSRAIEIDPKDVEAYINRGSLYNDQGKIELALADYNQAISLNPNFAVAYYNLGVAQMKIKNNEAARTNFQKAQQLFIDQGNIALADKIASILQQLP